MKPRRFRIALKLVLGMCLTLVGFALFLPGRGCATVLFPPQNHPTKGADFHCADYLGSPRQSIYTDQQRDTVLSNMQSAGAAVIRLEVSWVRMEETTGYLATVNTCVSKIVAHGMSAILTIVGTPPSAQSAYASGNVNTRRPPSDCLSASASCASIKSATNSLTSYLLAHGQTSSNFSIEVWNEPNNRNFWKPVCNSSGDIVDPNNQQTNAVCPDGTLESTKGHQQYAWLLKAAYQGVRKVSSTVKVAGGSALKSGYVHMDDWMADLYNDGVKSYFDVVTLHPYPNYGTDGACPTVSATFTGTHGVQSVVNVMAAHADGSKPIWFTEFGWSDTQDGNGDWIYCKETSLNPDQSSRLTDSMTYTYLPHNVVVEIWWLTDRTPLKSPWNSTCPSTSDWKCGTNLLNDNLSVPTTSINVYKAFMAAPQDP
jgi:hypothetical protein